MSITAEQAARRYGYCGPRHALVVGGPTKLVHGTMKDNLAKVAIDVVEHWECELRKPRLPHDVDLVLILRDTASAKAVQHIRKLAAESEVTVVDGSRKWVAMSQALVRARMCKPEMLAAFQALPDQPLELVEGEVADKPAVDMHIRSVPESFDQRAAQLKGVVTRLFEEDGFTSIMVTREEGKIRIEIERTEKRTL